MARPASTTPSQISVPESAAIPVPCAAPASACDSRPACTTISPAPARPHPTVIARCPRAAPACRSSRGSTCTPHLLREFPPGAAVPEFDAEDVLIAGHHPLRMTPAADLEPPIRVLAQAVRPATVRSLDAIHLGTALHARRTLTSFVTCDKRLLDAARTAGLPAGSPT